MKIFALLVMMKKEYYHLVTVIQDILSNHQLIQNVSLCNALINVILVSILQKIASLAQRIERILLLVIAKFNIVSFKVNVLLVLQIISQKIISA